MNYLGSKRKLAKHILPIILKDRKPGQLYIEPFCGGCNTLALVDNPRIGADIHGPLIGMWQAVALGWMPRAITEDEYHSMKSLSQQVSVIDPLITWAGFACSFGAKWWGGFRKDPSGRRDYVQEALRNARQQFPRLVGTTFIHTPYHALDLPQAPSIIYCDPPYASTTGYRDTTLDHVEFWKWCIETSHKGHHVYVSEYTIPDWVPATVLFQKTMSNTVCRNKTVTSTEYLVQVGR